MSGTSPSDQRLKTEIEHTELGLDFIRQLHPVQYRWRETMENHVGIRTHYGFIAQQVRDIITATDQDFGGYIYDEPNDVHLLRYEEFLAPMVAAIQTLADKLDILERRLAHLENS